MLPVQAKAYSIYNLALAAANGLLVAIYFVLLYTHVLGSNELLGTSAVTAGIGFAHIAYTALAYPFLRRKSEIGASLIGTAAFSVNLALLLLGTGNFSSPYFALWLLLILAVGIYRPSVPLCYLAVTTLYFIGVAFSSDFKPEFFTHTSIALLATYITGALGFWLWHSHHTKLKAGDPLATVTNKLSQEQLKSEILVRAIGDGVVVVDAEGKIQLLNPAAESLTGWSEAEAKTLDWHLVMKLAKEDDSPLDAASDPFAQAFSKKDSIINNDLTMLSKSGKKITLSLMSSPLFDEAGNLGGGIGVFRDISKAKANERQRDEFISTASHEMRTPVAAIEGYVSLALNPKVSQVDAKARTYLLRAQESARHLGKLFQDLLSTTKLEAGKLPNHPEVFDLGSLVKVTIDEFRLKAEKKHLSLGLVNSGHGGKNIQPLYYVNADPERIREVLSNLIDNAVKFTSHGEITITLSSSEGNVTVGVHDQGLGVNADDLPHLFEKFYRVDNSRTRSIGGTGLGLYLCRTIIELYNGRMWADSKVNEGSHFYFSLPRISTTQAQSQRSRAQQHSHVIERQSLETLVGGEPASEPRVAPKLKNNVE